MFQTALFNVLSKYTVNGSNDPVVVLLLQHPLAVKENDEARLQVEYLLDVAFSDRFHYHVTEDGYVEFGFDDAIFKLKDGLVSYSNQTSRYKIERYGRYFSIVTCGEVIAVLPLKYGGFLNG